MLFWAMIWTTTIYWTILYYNFFLASKYKYATFGQSKTFFLEKSPGSNCPTTISYLIILYCRIEVTFGSFQSLKIYQSNQRYKISNTKYLGSPHSILGAIFLRVVQIAPPEGQFEPLISSSINSILSKYLQCNNIYLYLLFKPTNIMLHSGSFKVT